MASPAVAVQQPSMEDKILAASAEAAKIAAIFSPAVSAAISAGVAVEPLVSGVVKLVVGIFHHHTGVQTK